MVHLLDFRPLELEPLSELRQRADEACKRARELRHQIQDALDSARDFNDRERTLPQGGMSHAAQKHPGPCLLPEARF